MRPPGGLPVGSRREGCAYLVMVSVKLKTTHGCPVVKSEYLTDILKVVSAQEHPLEIECFYPPVDEPPSGKTRIYLGNRKENKCSKGRYLYFQAPSSPRN